jgi:hypothetical protein
VGWTFIFAASGIWYIVAGTATLGAGVVAYFAWQLWWVKFPGPPGQNGDTSFHRAKG